MTEELTLEKIDSLIAEKLDAALKPLFEKMEQKEPEQTSEKTDSEKITAMATEILKHNLEGKIPKEKLDAYSLHDLYIANQFNADFGSKGGIKNPIEQKNDKTDAFKIALDKKKLDEVVFL